jgi:8-oxo-dGTP diphosphatase/2-hydroxy-dATP diphosphatase
MKKRGFGEGRWNGFGGKVRPGEGIEEAARRELEEEAGIRPREIRKRGVLTFLIEGDPIPMEVHVFSASSFDGEPRESDEMRPEWFRKELLPFAEMWPDDRYWLPLLLDGKDFIGRFHFKDHDTIVAYTLKGLVHEEVG